MSSKLSAFDTVFNEEYDCSVESADVTLAPGNVPKRTPNTKNSSNASRKRKHTPPNGKPYQCPSCPKRFSHECYLKMHLVAHESEEGKNFVCPECGRAYFRLGYLNLHMRSHIEGETTVPKPKKRRVEPESKVKEFAMFKTPVDESLMFEEQVQQHQLQEVVSVDSAYVSSYYSPSLYDDQVSNYSEATSSSGFSVETEWSHCFDFCELHPEEATSVDCEVFRITNASYKKDFSTVVLEFDSF